MLRPRSDLPPYEGLRAFAGDIHNHCGISYGHGSIEDAYRNARLQLDFASVTGHANWPDMPSEPRHVHDYHRAGFERLRRHWGHVQDVTESVHEDGHFVSLLSFEWHSMTYGDHCVYYRSGRGPLEPAAADDLAGLRDRLRALGESGLPALAIPHHIGYLSGHRGIDWDTYTEEFSPVLELVSMHGCGESDSAPRPYLHTMGPRDAASTAVAGLRRGHHVGFIGSTDHHSAHPGSYGYGRAMVWARDLTRAGVWEAIRARRTYAVTGDRIMLATSVNGAPMGAVTAAEGPRRIHVEARGGDAIDDVELVRNGTPIARTRPAVAPGTEPFRGVVPAAVGWGEVGVPVTWEVDITLSEGRIDAVEPRLHGYDTLADQAGATDAYSFSSWSQPDARTVRLCSRTAGNPTVTTDATQHLALHLQAPTEAVLTARVNGREVHHPIRDLVEGARTGYVGGFISGAFVLGRAVPEDALTVRWDVEDTGSGADEDWYYVRVRQANGQWAWSSPTWVRSSTAR